MVANPYWKNEKDVLMPMRGGVQRRKKEGSVSG